MATTTNTTTMDSHAKEELRQARSIFLRTKGRIEGPITRLVSPSDIGQSIKPFVLLDRFVVDATSPVNFPLHPHSGIATLTALLDGSLHILDSRGKPKR